MQSHQLDNVSRRLARSRRTLVGAGVLAASGLKGFSTLTPLDAVQAKKRKRRPLVLNTFGCVDVGGKCRGNSDNCCSGVCQGRKPKKGKKDKSVCVAHNTGGCSVASDSCLVGGTPTPCPPDGACLRTTGNAGFCGDFTRTTCQACQRDRDCEIVFGAGSACVICATSTCEATGRRLCVAPA